MIARQLLASVLVGLLAAPAWCATNPVVGTAGPSQGATVRGAGLLPGTTLFSGDFVDVGSRGDAALSFGRGSMVRLSEETTLRLEKGDNRVAFELLRGRVAFRSSEQLPLEAHLADANIRSANGLAAVGVMAFRSPKVVVVLAERGSLLISTAHDAKSVSLREGESVEMRLDDQRDDKKDDEKDRKRAAGASAPGLSHGQWKAIAIITTGVALAVGLLIAEGELGLDDSQKRNLVSPFQFPPR
jgi:hypothetical protein